MSEQNIKGITWRSGRDTIGIVAIQKAHGWKAYVGVGQGFSEAADIAAIAAHGSSLMEAEARAFFPHFAGETYAP